MSMQAGGERFAGIGDEAVREKTGRSWSEWVAALDREGGRDLETVALSRLLEDRFDVSGWWSQMLAVGYEQATGRRESTPSPGLSATVTRTYDVPVDVLFDLWHDDARRRRWYGPDDFAIEDAIRPRSLRVARWIDAGRFTAVSFAAKGATKSQVSVEQQALAEPDDVNAVKRHWAEALERLREHLAV